MPHTPERPITIKQRKGPKDYDYIPPAEGEHEGKFVSRRGKKTTFTPEERAKIEEHFGKENVVWMKDPETGEEEYMVKGDEYPDPGRGGFVR
jgi:hypothetical protein